MLFKKLISISFAIIIFLSLSSTAIACACCAERGTYSVWTGMTRSYRADLLKDIRFGDTAEVFMTEAGFEKLRGIAVIEKDFESVPDLYFNLADVYSKNSWSLTFKTPTGRTGSLVLPRPSRMTTRMIDSPSSESTTPEVTLHKEFIFEGRVSSGSGFFKRSVVNSPIFTLIFFGRGNGCDNAEDFKNWRLEVNGSRANYAFFGKLKAAA